MNTKSMKLFFMSIMLMGLCHMSLARAKVPYVVDLYKSNQLSVSNVTDKYKNQLQQLADIFGQPGQSNPENNKKLLSLMTEIVTGLNKMGKFSYASISPVMYPSNQTIYYTIDLVDQNDKKRLPNYLPKPKDSIPDPEHLIQFWTEYEKLGFKINIEKHKAPKFRTCPAYHCIFGFDEKPLRKYKSLFNTLVPKHKTELATILHSDKDENKRAAAAYLLAHIKNRDELIDDLIPAMFDSNAGVRNNVMRVLGIAMLNNPPKKFPVDRVIKLLDYPTTTDRNKALLMLLALSKDSDHARYIAIHAKYHLISQLKLSQPNLHDLSFEILKNISGKNYAERDYKAWSAWLDNFNKNNS